MLSHSLCLKGRAAVADIRAGSGVPGVLEAVVASDRQLPYAVAVWPNNSFERTRSAVVPALRGPSLVARRSTRDPLGVTGMAGDRRSYEAVPDWSEAELRRLISNPQSDRLHLVPLAASLHLDSGPAAEQICLQLTSAADPEVRGNAILGLGHIARRFSHLSDDSRRVFEKALCDESEFVRGQAESAVDDAEHFLGWRLRRDA